MLPASQSLASTRGGLLYDNWAKTLKKETPETMKDDKGNVIPNSGHDFRCKNCHAWDYKGKDGIYGPKYQNKPYVSKVNLAKESKTHTIRQLAKAIKLGHGKEMPVYKDHISDEDIKHLATFLVAKLTNTDEIFSLSEKSSTKYVLNDVSEKEKERGFRLYNASCESCHGSDGTKVMIDEAYTLGSHSRQKAYEDHHKMKFGNPGTEMEGYYDSEKNILAILGAICNSKDFPAGGSKANKDKEKDGCGKNYVE